MTNFEALKAEIVYQLPDNSFKKVLLDRGLNDTGEYNPGNKRAMELCIADSIKILVSAPNISESGFSISVTEKKELIKLASTLYTKNGEANPFNPVISSVRPW